MTSAAFVPGTIFLVLAIIAVSLRWYVRVAIIKRVALEDYLVTGALLASLGLYIGLAIGEMNGFGPDMLALSAQDIETIQKVAWLSPITWSLSSVLCKLSIVWQYRQIFLTKRFTLVCDILIVLLVSFGICAFFMCVFICVPVRSIWDVNVLPDFCLNREGVHYSINGFNVLMDVVIFAMPFPLLSSLNIQKKEKQALVLVFLLGGFVCITPIMRLNAFYHFLNTGDYYTNLVYIALWSQIEVNLGIVCACVTILRPLYKTFFSRSRLPAQIPEPETRARKDVELKGLSKLDQLKSQRTYSSVEMISQDRNDMDSQVSLARNSTVSSYNHEFESAGL